MGSSSSFVFLLSFFFIFQLSCSIPFIVLHGMSNQCSDKKVSRFTELLRNLSNSEGYCIEVGDGTWDSFFLPMTKQAEIVCNKVKKMEELRGGYNIVGRSQGNLIGRGVVEFCDGGPPVKNFVSLAGPHAGTASFPHCGVCASGVFCRIANNLIKSHVYKDCVQTHLAPSGYLKLPNNIPGYLEKCRYLPKLNNEIPDKRNSTYKERFSSLENLVLIMDTVLIPKETSWFGYYPHGAFQPVLPPQQTKLYTEDWIGLKALDDAGRVKYISVPGKHLGISESDVKRYVVPYLEEKVPMVLDQEEITKSQMINH